MIPCKMDMKDIQFKNLNLKLELDIKIKAKNMQKYLTT